MAETGSTARIDACATPSLAPAAANSDPPNLTRPPTIRAARTVRAARNHAPIANEHERRVLRQRRSLPEQSEHVVAERQRHRDASEDVNAVGDRRSRSDSRRGSKRADRTFAERDPRMLRSSDCAKRCMVLRHDRALQRQRRCQLADLHPQVRPQGAEGRGADMGAAGKSCRALLPVAAARVPVERHRYGDDDRCGRGEEHDGVPDDRNPGRPTIIGPQQTLHNLLSRSASWDA